MARKHLTKKQLRELRSIKERHVGYNAEMTPEEMVVHGRSRGFSYLTIGRQLNLEALRLKNESPKVARRFKEASRIAYRMHEEYPR